MEIKTIKSRSVLFTTSPDPSWNLNMHLILGKKHNFLIDTGLGSNCMAYVNAYLKDSELPLIVINTHYHWDHIWGNAFVDAEMIVAHKKCLEIIEEKWDLMLERSAKYKDGEVIKKLPDTVFEEEMDFPEDGIKLIYTPGHTIDCISVLDLEDRVLNVGDNIGDDDDHIVPGIYLDKDISQFLKTLDTYDKLDFDTIISGHNRVLDKSVLGKIRKELNNS